jgi:hypothetical protein
LGPVERLRPRSRPAPEEAAPAEEAARLKKRSCRRSCLLKNAPAEEAAAPAKAAEDLVFASVVKSIGDTWFIRYETGINNLKPITASNPSWKALHSPIRLPRWP